MIVADSSFLVHGLLRDAKLLASDHIITPDLALHEVANSIWKHEYILKDLKNGMDFITNMTDLIDSGAIILVTPNRKLVEKAYDIAARYKTSFYNCVFIALAIETGSGLKTMDDKQEKILKAEKPKS